MLIAGIDEAGYGPLLGPLVVSAAAFRFPEPLNVSDITPALQLWQKLSPMVVAKPPVKSGQLIIADSKVVHRLADGDKYMERAILTMLRLLPNAAPAPVNWNELLARLSHSPGPAHEPAPPWSGNAPVPAFGEAGAITIAARMLQSVISSGNTPPAGLWTRVMDVPEFNRLVAATANKAAVLTSITMMHARNLHDRFHESDLLLLVDKQGGRDHYTRLLLETFPGWPLKVMLESAPESRYLICTARGNTLIIFREKAEQYCLATALASMICKYVRELYMTMFNQWWGRSLPDLEPTAGYYTDAMRWLARAEPEFPRLGIKREMVVRIK